jgi:nucleotide-binding universal stress UspA family protein
MRMLKRILVPTDGSAASMVAVDTAVGFAHDSGARIVGLHVTPLLPLLSEGTSVVAVPESEELASVCLGYVERRAAQARVPAEVLLRRADSPSEAILAAARELGCDLIVMALHGKSMGHAMLPGSQTAAVLSHSPVPVLVVPRAGA